MPGVIPNPLRTNGIDRRAYSFRFFPQGTSNTPLTKAAGTVIDPGGCVASVTRQAVAGRFLVTMTDPAYQVAGVQATTQLAGNTTDLYAQVGTISNQGTSTPITFIVRLLTGATETDMSADANNSVSVTLETEEQSGS